MKHISALKQEGLWLFLATAWCLALLGARMYYTGHGLFLFLVWNLFLAWIPWILSAGILNRTKWTSPVKWISAGIWILFLPNAPYILTDLVHLRHRGDVPFWLDLIMILSFALTGLVLGLTSVRHLWEDRQIPAKLKGLLFPAIFLLTAFGVYLGRYLRWNSWEVVSAPGSLVSDLMQWVYHPSLLKEPLAFTIGFGVLLWMLFWLPGKVGLTAPLRSGK